jgi:hypothetical protein
MKADGMGELYSTNRKDEKFIKTLFGKPEGTRPLRRPEVHGRIILEWMLLK